MSEMEIFHGYFERSYLDVDPADTDKLYALEESHGCHFVRVEGELYRVWSSDLHVSPHGFAVVVSPTPQPQLLLYWYNGGAGLHEVAASAINAWIKEGEE